MTIEEAGFREFSRTEGRLKAEGLAEEMPYKARNFLNGEGTIGCAEIEVQGKANCMFISKTEKGVVMTMVGAGDGPFPIEIDGYHSIMCVGEDSPFEDSYKAHRDAVEAKGLVADEGWLKKTVPEIPQRALDATMKMLQDLTGAMEGMMKGVGQAMGQAMEGMAKGMAEAMGGIAEAMGGAVEAGGAKKAKVAKPKKAGKPKKKRG